MDSDTGAHGINRMRMAAYEQGLLPDPSSESDETCEDFEMRMWREENRDRMEQLRLHASLSRQSGSQGGTGVGSSRDGRNTAGEASARSTFL